MRYKKNVPLNTHDRHDVPSPYALWDGLPFYLYTGKREKTNVVSARTPPVDEVFTLHKKRARKENPEEVTRRQQEILDGL